MAGKSLPPKRRNKTVQLGDMIGDALDPAFKKRGFASRDLVAHWGSIAPTPWDKLSIPDKLAWPRRDRPDPEGAVLHLRCMEGHGLALVHEGPAIAAAVNRYFGYLLVGSVRLSPLPFAPARALQAQRIQPLGREKLSMIAAATAGVEDMALKQALEKLGRGLMGRDK